MAMRRWSTKRDGRENAGVGGGLAAGPAAGHRVPVHSTKDKGTSVRFTCLSDAAGHGIIPNMDLASLESYLVHLRRLPFVKEVGVESGVRRPDDAGDAIIRIRTKRRTYRLLAEVKTSQLTRMLAGRFLAPAAQGRSDGRVVLAPYIPPATADMLNSHGANHVDLAGNLRVALGDDHLAWIAGRKAARTPAQGRSIGIAGYQVLFTLLADETLATRPIRILAEEAGVSKTAVSDMLVRLENDGHLSRRHPLPKLVNKRALWDRWLHGYETLVRPRSIIDRFATAEPSVTAFENLVERRLKDDPDWVWGGAAAAFRLTGRFRGETTVLHHRRPDASLPRALDLVRARHGNVVLLRGRGRMAFDGEAERTAHPLIVHAELIAQGGDREREAAEEIREQFLGSIK